MINNPTIAATDSALTLVAPEKLGYTKLYLDLVRGQGPATGFYLAESIETVADRLDRVTYDRERLADIMARQNREFGAGPETLERIEQLRDPRSVCLFSGQQAGLFGGPFLTLVKALGVIKAAEVYSEQLGRPVLPCFWIAGDDHDFDEAGETYLLDRSGEVDRIAYERNADQDPPVADITLDDTEELSRVLDQFKSGLGESDFTPDLYALAEQAYTSGVTLVTAFGRLMTYFTRDLGLLLFNPADPEVKAAAAPFFEAMLDKQEELHSVLGDTAARLVESGYHVQVEKSEAATGLFNHQPARVPIAHQDGGFAADDKFWSKAELLDEIKSNPEQFSPDALTRPVMQSFLLPVISQKCGPSELAYMAQLNPLFELFGLPAPVHAARPTLTLVERRIEKPMTEMEIAFEDLTGDVEQVINRVLGKTFPVDLQQALTELRQRISEHFDQFAEQALGFEPGQKRNAEQVKGKIDYLLNGFEGKLFAAHKKKGRQMRDKVYRIANALYPRHGLQERTINVCSFLARYGPEVVPYVFERMNSEETGHQLISMRDYEA